MSDHNSQREEVFSKSVRAGKRTYFFDVKSTKANDYYLTITESKKRIGDDGNPFFEKHKIFLYREDFQKFVDGLNEAIQHVGTLKVDNPDHSHGNSGGQSESPSPFSDVNFDDLGK
ncbi:MAG TPA: DUF3276 family protein [Bacteroidia bacterium]|nr:DUF3276 family protein [Bacteroidia bacterium]